ncbi:MAG: site-specific DNA-methyltransferase [Armatimonadetes bacterium]|nr:site-specific DNA-methyltransferase [Armatimonadota bacterium]
MARNKPLVPISRNYLLTTVQEAKQVARSWLKEFGLDHVIKFGLPEIDDRYHFWRVPLLKEDGKTKLGELVIDAYTTEVLPDKSTRPEILEARLLKKDAEGADPKRRSRRDYPISPLRNTVAFGDCVDVIDDMPAGSVDLVFTSPPYFNARPEYSEYEQYEQYLFEMRQMIKRCHRVLNEGRFFVMNTSPVLLRRASRSESSRRLAVPFDLHRIFVEEGFDFIDDIIWMKPEGAGWATGRGRRFAADRNPLQYKAVPVTEYVLVYRKKSDLLIDWFIRNHPDPSVVESSRIGDDYERTNVWRIQPATNSQHPAAFPMELAEKVVSYYSFRNDVVMDPMAGSGTVGAAASRLGRRFVLIDSNPAYLKIIRESVVGWLGRAAEGVLYINCDPKSLPLGLFDCTESDNGEKE